MLKCIKSERQQQSKKMEIDREREVMRSILKATYTENPLVVFRYLFHFKDALPKMSTSVWMDLVQTVFHVIKCEDIHPVLKQRVVAATSNLSIDLLTRMRHERVEDNLIGKVMVTCFVCLKEMYTQGKEGDRQNAKALLRRLCSKEMNTPETARNVLHFLVQFAYAEPFDVFYALGVEEAMSPYYIPCIEDIVFARNTGHADFGAAVSVSGEDMLDTLIVSYEDLPRRVARDLTPCQKAAVSQLARHLIQLGVTGNRESAERFLSQFE